MNENQITALPISAKVSSKPASSDEEWSLDARKRCADENGESCEMCSA